MNMRALPALLLLGIVLTAATAAAETHLTSGDVPIQRGMTSQVVLEGLERPWAMTWLPDGSMLITERPGRVRLVQDGKLAPEPVPGVPDILAFGQGGLLDVTAHPRFADNRLVYFSYAHGTRDANRTRVARATFDGKALSDWQVIFEVNQAKPGGQHFGSRFAWLPDGTLLVSIGDGGNPPLMLDDEYIRNQAQNLDSHLGKILRLNDDGSVPEDNPFVNTAGAAPEVWSYGHRNIQGMAWDPVLKRLWASEHGALGGDEFNAPQAGRNYGWPLVTHSREYIDGSPISATVAKPGMVDPLLVWLTAIAPSGLMVYDGEAFPEWRGDVFAGGLITQDIRRIELDEAGNVRGQRALRIGQRVRDVRQGPDGLIYALTDEDNGKLIRFSPQAGGPTAP